MAKIGRNQPCPCGSGRKYKKCYLNPLGPQCKVAPATSAPPYLAAALQKHAAAERVRIAQQGLGNPIVSGKIGEYTFVASGNTLHYSRDWKTFSDFLIGYIKTTLGEAWGNAEIAKPLEERHPILQWYDFFCRYQAAHKKSKGEISSGPMTGVVYCYLGLAYSLYLLKHNAELQSRLIARLKDIKQFQGAYYELLVANCLIRAGFSLELEDEKDQETKHCEFSARSEKTGKRYWVEAKMRSEPDVLGKTIKDGSTSRDPTSRLTDHLRGALQKPAPDQRMIFIDLNAEPNENGGAPAWLDKAVRRLDDRERDLVEGQEAYVFVTNLSFHRALDSSTPRHEALAYGLGISDFSKPGEIRLADWYRQKLKHIDAHNVMGAIKSYPQIPDTINGQPASEAFSDAESNRILIGETYFFENVEEDGVIGTVMSVAVLDQERQACVAITTKDGKAMIIKSDLSDAEYDDYKKYGDAYFGEPKERNHHSKNVFDFYEWLIGCYSETPKERLLELANDRPDIDRLRGLDHFNLVLEVCEGWAASIESNSKKSEANDLAGK